AEIARIGLDGEPPVTAAVLLECRPQQLGGPDRELLDELPSDLVLGRRRHLPDQLGDARLPGAHLVLQRGEADHRVAGRPHRSVRDGVGQLRDRGGVVPQARGRGLRHLLQRALVRGRGGGHGARKVPRERGRRNRTSRPPRRTEMNFYAADRAGSSVLTGSPEMPQKVGAVVGARASDGRAGGRSPQRSRIDAVSKEETMNTKCRASCAALPILALLAVGGGGAAARAEEKKPVVGLVMKSLGNEFFKSMEEGDRKFGGDGRT